MACDDEDIKRDPFDPSDRALYKVRGDRESCSCGNIKEFTAAVFTYMKYMRHTHTHTHTLTLTHTHTRTRTHAHTHTHTHTYTLTVF